MEGIIHMMQDWFRHAKLGIWVHWGIYSVLGIPESWSFYNGEISYEDYMKQSHRFTAKNYDPGKWAELFTKAGAKYAVLTAKHHDGVALWDTKLSDLSIVKISPASKDLIAPYCNEMRKAGIKVGIYFSHLDWSHPDYASVYHPDYRTKPGNPDWNKYKHPENGENYAAWERFIKFHQGQLKELSTNYGPVDLFWFDGDWDRNSEQWKMSELRDMLHELNPEVVLNSRMRGCGDYETPEQGFPIIPPDGSWEFCMTMNDSWGYQKNDKNNKSTRQLIRIFSECIGMGGNLLLDIGPFEDGTFDPEQENRLLEMGNWIKRNEEAIYPTKKGLPEGHFNGATTLSDDENTIFLFQFDRPWESIPLKGIKNKIRKISMVDSGEELTFKTIGGAPWLGVPGTIWIEMDEKNMDPFATVIKVELDGKLDLYRGKGQVIDSN